MLYSHGHESEQTLGDNEGQGWASLVAQMVENPPVMWKTWVQSLEKEMATHSSILAWKILRMEEPGRLQSVWSQSWTRLRDFTSWSFEDIWFAILL